RGNYGHGFDTAFLEIPEIDIVAVADADETGRQAAQIRTGARRIYANYRTMLAQEKSNLVAIGPRFVGERVAMVTAAAAAGAHIFLEKPMAATLAEADTMLDACAHAGVKMAVGHQGRLHPATLHTMHLVEQGAIGRLRQIRGYGKMDHRGGGQDLMVLGTHVLDLMRLFGGNAHWASAELLVGSTLATPADVRAGTEEIGPVAGDGLRATYGFENGVLGFFESFAGLGGGEDLFGLDLVGETGQLSLRGGFFKRLLRYPHPYVIPGAADDRWEVVPVPDAAPGEVLDGTPPDRSDAPRQRGNQRLVRDLLAAIAEDRAPLGSGERARAALELIQAVAAAHAAGGRIDIPLVERGHPYAGMVDK
ncbi:MAG: Gfo/Idh/MocA family oxidoreductase, partial [Caldilineaceae bacterium]|nr:Gfo/Idh/MocA family oxidoreductase [Caldilineaceae bacterium]